MPKEVASPHEQLPIPIVPIQDGVVVCVDKKTNKHKWQLLKNVKYDNRTLEEYLNAMELRIIELVKARIADLQTDTAWKEQTNELLAKIIAEIEKGE